MSTSVNGNNPFKSYPSVGDLKTAPLKVSSILLNTEGNESLPLSLPTKIKKLRIHHKALNKFEIIQQTKKWQVAWLSWMLYCLIRLPARLLRTTQIKFPKHSTKFA